MEGKKIVHDEEIRSALQFPIAGECYMLAKDWWDSWIQYTEDTSRKIEAPGIIYNYGLLYDPTQNTQ